MRRSLKVALLRRYYRFASWRDEGIAMREKLRGLDVAVEYEHYPDAEHGFACSLGPSDDYRSWLTRCADFIARR